MKTKLITLFALFALLLQFSCSKEDETKTSDETLEGSWQITSLTIVDTSFDPSTSETEDVTFSGYLRLYSDGDYSFSCESEWNNGFGSSYNASFSGSYTVNGSKVTLDDMTSFTIDSDSNITWDFELATGINLRMTLSKSLSVSAMQSQSWSVISPITIEDMYWGTALPEDVTSSGSLKLDSGGSYTLRYSAVWDDNGLVMRYGATYGGSYYITGDEIVMEDNGRLVIGSDGNIVWSTKPGTATLTMTFVKDE